MQNKYLIFLFWAATLVRAVPCRADAANIPNTLHVVEFAVRTGLEIPTSYREKLMEDLVRELRRTELFEKVATERDGGANAGSQLRLTGEITDYKKGSRLMRYMVPGVGKTKLVAEYRLVGQPGETVILTGKADGMVVLGGLLKGASDGATSGLAKEIAKKVKSTLRKKR